MSTNDLKEWAQLMVLVAPLFSVQVGRWIGDGRRHREHMQELKAVHQCLDDLKSDLDHYARLTEAHWLDARAELPPSRPPHSPGGPPPAR